MRLFKTVVPALLALLMLGLAAAPISAQTADVDDSTGFDELEGLQRAVSRSFSADMMAMFDIATPDAMPTGWFLLNTMVLEFDSEDNAAAANETLLAELDSGDIMADDTQLEDVELDVDMDHTARQAAQEEEGMTTYALMATAQDGNYLYLVVGVTFGEDPAAVASSALSIIKDAEAEDGEGTFDENGASEGGLWAKMPTLEQMQEQAPAFVETVDEVIFPVAEGTPAA
jgi:hypothetical protein